ncbi:MAG: helix-turn-helix transcriptional regulator [Angustibacter sp.]
MSSSRTRDQVARLVLQHGPITASAVAARLGLTGAAVRRHLDALEAGGLVTCREPARSGRGRPARPYVLTELGHSALSSGYDDLAASALDFLAERLGPDAVRDFAADHVAQLQHRYADAVAGAGRDIGARTRALADALAEDGYAASARAVGVAEADHPVRGIQLCQGHCPVQRVAARFPQLCEVEAEAFSRLLGVHVQRLATLAAGAHVCTTYIPTPPSTSDAVAHPSDSPAAPTTPDTPPQERKTR